MAIRGYGALIQFVGPDSHRNWIIFLKKYEIYCTFWACVCGILGILFWLLYFQNRREKNLIIIALGTTLLSAVAFFLKIDQPTGTPSSAHEFYWYTSGFLLGLGFTAIILTLAKIFERKISIPIKLYCVFSSFSVITDTYFFESRFAAVIYALNFCVCLYLIIVSWRKLRGPQWSVVVGISLSFVFAFLFAYNLVKFKRFPFPFVYLYMTGAFLSFPLSLMVYVAGRFKEILNEVRSHVNELLKITE